jgi:ABC-type multidrug transport system fused ATPase/permease subunit
MQVQEHIGRLPVAFYDENRTGTLVARIMTDVEGVRNLVGTGLWTSSAAFSPRSSPSPADLTSTCA